MYKKLNNNSYFYDENLRIMQKKPNHFINLKGFAIVATFFSLWLSVFFDDRVEDILAYMLIFSFGILHGANDINLLKMSKSRAGRQRVFWRTLLYYVVFVMVSAVVFYLLPFLALLVFILFSAYHFGEQHWNAKIKRSHFGHQIFYTAYGFCILFLLFYSHSEMTSMIVKDITNFWLSTNYYRLGLLISMSIFVLLYAVLFKQINAKIHLELFYLGVFFIVFHTASLLWAFAIYFILWHSLPSLEDQIKLLYGSISKRNIYRYLKTSSVYWIVSLVGLAFFFLFFKESENSFVSIFFSFLAAITFPHVCVIARLNNS